MGRGFKICSRSLEVIDHSTNELTNAPANPNKYAITIPDSENFNTVKVNSRLSVSFNALTLELANVLLTGAAIETGRAALMD